MSNESIEDIIRSVNEYEVLKFYNTDLLGTMYSITLYRDYDNGKNRYIVIEENERDDVTGISIKNTIEEANELYDELSNKLDGESEISIEIEISEELY